VRGGFLWLKNHNPNQSETVIRKETNGAASESLTASLIDSNFYRNLIKRNSDDKECQTARTAGLKTHRRPLTRTYHNYLS
jgi:hypothetical protein